MLKLRRRRHRRAGRPDTSLPEHPDLRIHDLLDDPALRRAMGLDQPDADDTRRPDRAVA